MPSNLDSISRQQTGKLAEDMALQHLEKQGLTMIARNYYCRHGEIDLIMQEKDDIVFVEVRKRSRLDYGTAFESVNKRKINKLIKTATHFLQTKKWLHKINSRFDIVAIHLVAGSQQLEWIKNAFWIEHYE